MDALKKWMISGLHYTKPPPSQSGCSLKNFSSNHPCIDGYSAAFKYVPQPAATTFSYTPLLSLIFSRMSRDRGHKEIDADLQQRAMEGFYGEVNTRFCTVRYLYQCVPCTVMYTSTN